MNESILAVQELRNENPRIVCQFRQHEENKMRFRMAPPRSAERFAGNDPDHTRNGFVLFEKQAVSREGGEHRFNGLFSRGVLAALR